MVLKASSNIGELSSSESYMSHLFDITSTMSKESTIGMSGINISLEEEPEYQLILKSNSLLQEIDEEIAATKRFVSELYSKKFPELESLIPNKIDYIRTIRAIGNEMDMTLVDLSSILKSNTIMIVSVTASTTSGQPLSEEELKECFRGCEEILRLDQDRSIVLEFVESRMNKIAPNLCALIGASLAAQLVGLAGGLVALSKIPSCNVQVMGQEKNILGGLSFASVSIHAGILSQSEIVQKVPPFLKRKALKILAGKVTLAARMDSYQTDIGDSSEGMKLLLDVEEKLEKIQEPPKARTKKALPIPEEKKRNKR
eukprot:gene17359-23976_t